MFRRITFALGAFTAIVWAAPSLVFAQQQASPAAAPTHEVQPVQMAVPFGVVEGRLVVSGDNLIFIDDQQPQNSFAIPRQDIRNSNAENGTLTLDLAKPVQSRTGPQSNLVLRFANPAAAQGVTLWFHATRAAAAAPSAVRTDASGAAPAAEQPGTMSFQVKHDHLIGSDTGRLIITPGQVIYESVTDVNSSRRWNMSDIKEVKRDGPYKLKVVPFTGDEYNFNLLGQGMGPDQYRTLVDRVTNARLQK